jgi:hypothetical protein
MEPIIKVWNMDKEDKNGGPLLLRSLPVRASVGTTCMEVLEDLSQLAVGLMDGSVILIKGDIGRDRAPKQRVVQTPTGFPVTGETKHGDVMHEMEMMMMLLLLRMMLLLFLQALGSGRTRALVSSS